MIPLIAWAIAFGATTLAIYGGLVALFGPVKPDSIDARIQRQTELRSTYDMLVDLLGREPTTQEIWAASPVHIGE